MILKIKKELIYWRGPSPYYFIEISQVQSRKIKDLSSQLTYGWGVIPVSGKIGNTEFTTSLFPKGDLYLLPIKNLVRFAENLELGQVVPATLTFTLKSR